MLADPNISGPAPVAGGYTEGARARNTASQVIPNSDWTEIILGAEDWDTDNMHHLTINNTRLTCNTPGKYVCNGWLEYGTHSTGHRRIAIWKNGTHFSAHHTIDANGTHTDCMNVVCILDLVEDDFIELRTWQNRGGDLTISREDFYSAYLVAQRIG